MIINLCSKYSLAISNSQKGIAKHHSKGLAYAAGKVTSRP